MLVHSTTTLSYRDILWSSPALTTSPIYKGWPYSPLKGGKYGASDSRRSSLLHHIPYDLDLFVAKVIHQLSKSKIEPGVLAPPGLVFFYPRTAH